MRNRKWYEWLLTAVYIAMILLCVYLNAFSGQPEGLENIIVNVVMFVLVGLIFLNCERNCFFPMNRILQDLDKATDRIRKDAMNAHAFLWDQYQKDQVQLFSEKRLQELYEDYVYELKRIAQMDKVDKAYYKCELEQFIGYGLVDETMHRNLLNQVAGAMTGFGILGTFVGLALGLQSFNTGTTAEITNSIAPLMDGIKVAFHTSIYGMIFSLVFNYAYKRKLDEAEASMQRFLNAHKKYVLPDKRADGTNQLLHLQQLQLESMQEIDRKLPSYLKSVLDPAFTRFEKTLQDYSNMASRSQLEALRDVVDAFVREMNSSMGNAFSQLSDTVNQVYQSQQQNARLMQEILQEAGTGQENMQEQNRQFSALLSALDAFQKQVLETEDVLSQDASRLLEQSQHSRELIRQEQSYLNDLAAYRQSLDKFSATFNESLKAQEKLLGDIHGAVQKLPRDLGNTFKLLDDNLEDVEMRMHASMQQLNDSLAKVTAATQASYSGLEESCSRVAGLIEAWRREAASTQNPAYPRRPADGTGILQSTLELPEDAETGSRGEAGAGHNRTFGSRSRERGRV